VRRPALATLALSLLALLFGWETRQALRTAPGGRDTAVAAAGAWQPGLPTPDPQPAPDPGPIVSAITARPLFRQDRQPFRDQAATASVRNYEAELSRYSLLGVLRLGEEPVGIVTGKTGNKTDRWELKVGDALPGFTVKEVGIDGLRLTADGQEFLLPLYAGAPTAVGGALRTETTRRNVTQPNAAPGTPSSAKTGASGVPPESAALTAPVPAQPQTAPVYTPRYRPPPARRPRYVPGR